MGVLPPLPDRSYLHEPYEFTVHPRGPLPDADPFAWVDDALDELSRLGLRRSLSARTSPQSALIDLDGRQLVNFGSNDYLGLAGDDRLQHAAAEACGKWGVGGGASPLITGRTRLHVELEQSLAEFLACEAALLFPTGFAANAGIIPALADEGDVIFADAKNHASLIDGCRLSRSARFVYAHADAGELASLLEQTTTARHRLIATDSLFSMDGDLAPLAAILQLAEAHDAMVLVDEAHAIGVLGEHGRGALEHLDLVHVAGSARVLRVGTLSKALGAAGGFVAGPRNVIEWLANRARTYAFSTAAPAPVLAAAMVALDIVRDEPHRRRELVDRAGALRRKLREQGWNTGRSESHIIPIVVGEPERAMSLATMLRDQGYFVPGIRPPTVPSGESLLRISLCFHHTAAMVDGLVTTLADLRPASFDPPALA